MRSQFEEETWFLQRFDRQITPWQGMMPYGFLNSGCEHPKGSSSPNLRRETSPTIPARQPRTATTLMRLAGSDC